MECKPKPNPDLSSSNSNTWPSAQCLVIGSCIDGCSINEVNLESLFKHAGYQLESITFACPATPLPSNTFVLLGKFCPNVKSLEAERLDNVDLRTLETLGRNCRKLKNFQLKDWTGKLRDEHLLPALEYRWNLTTLKLIGSSITKNCLGAFPKTLVNLDLRSCKFLTPRSLNKLKVQCPFLKTLRTSFAITHEILDEISDGWPELESMIVPTNLSLDYSKFLCIKDLFICGDCKVSMKPIVSRLKFLWKFQLKVREVDDEILFFGSKLAQLIINTRLPLPNNVVQSLPFCKSLEILDVMGTDISMIIDPILSNCKEIKLIRAPDSTLTSDYLGRLLRRGVDGSPTVIEAQVLSDAS